MHQHYILSLPLSPFPSSLSGLHLKFMTPTLLLYYYVSVHVYVSVAI